MTPAAARYRLVTIAIAAIAFVAGAAYQQAPWKPATVHAQDRTAAWLYVEPGVTNVVTPDGNRRFAGKIAIDLRNGNIWALPTLQAAPYPRDIATNTPPTVEPVFLGRYNLSSIEAHR
jgi:hypothetical protein